MAKAIQYRPPQRGPEHHKWLIPREGLLVRDPRNKHPLPAAGYWKPWTGPEGRYWRRRVTCGDVSEGLPPSVENPKAEKREE